MCLSDETKPGIDRRTLMRRLTAMGLSVPAAMAALNGASQAGPMSFLDRERFIGGLEGLLQAAKLKDLAGYKVFELASTDLPWKEIGLQAKKGQEVTLLVGGRVWASREADIWFEPGVCLHMRTTGKRPIYNPMNNTGTMTAAHDGPLEIARALGEWANEDGELWTPPEAYQQAEVKIYGIALVWKGRALDGLRKLVSHGDVGGIIGTEIERLKSPRKLPEGWVNLYMTGGGPIVFNDVGNGEISCQARSNAGILTRPVSLDLKPGTKLSWRWIVEEIPSRFPETEVVTHDYVSIGAEYDDGQDLTYIWSHSLPAGHVFRCPFARWESIETHMAIRSGFSELGTWLSEERDLYEDYKAHIGGPATKVVAVWLLGITLFQRRQGAARFADIKLTGADGAALTL